MWLCFSYSVCMHIVIINVVCVYVDMGGRGRGGGELGEGARGG